MKTKVEVPSVIQLAVVEQDNQLTEIWLCYQQILNLYSVSLKRKKNAFGLGVSVNINAQLLHIMFCTATKEILQVPLRLTDLSFSYEYT